MRTPLIVAAALTFLILVPVLHAEDWTTTDGKTYRDITVISHDSLNVTVLDRDGGATLPLANLPASLQKRFNFDAKAAALLQAQDDAKAAAIQAKMAADLKARQEAKAAQDAAKAREEAEAQQQEDAAKAKAKADFDSAAKVNVAGQVFIVTKEKETVNLAQIHVGLFSEDQIDAAIAALTLKAKSAEKELQPALDAQSANCSKLQDEVDAGSSNPNLKDAARKLSDAMDEYKATLLKFYSYRSQAYYISGFPDPIAKADSDTDGKFSLQVPKTGSWVLEGAGQQSVDGKVEQFFWLKEVSPDEVARNQVILNNDNLSGVYSEGSLISALDQPTIDDMVTGKLAAFSQNGPAAKP
jgi:hypothetical protein